MAIAVQHGPNLSRYASVLAQSAKQTENYGRMKQIAEFMQQVKQGNREYELGKEQNRLTGRGQDITYDLGLKDAALQTRGLDLQEVNQNRMHELGLREQDLAELTQAQGYELGLLGVKQDKYLGELNAVSSSGDRAVNWIRGNYVTAGEANARNTRSSYYSR